MGANEFVVQYVDRAIGYLKKMGVTATYAWSLDCGKFGLNHS